MGGSSEGRALEETPTWAVAIVCFVLIAIFILIDQIIHKIEQWFEKKQQRGLHESLEKIKAELMLMGFMSLLLSVGTTPITNICISKTAASTWHPCSSNYLQNTPIYNQETSAGNINIEELEIRRLVDIGDSRRVLVGSSGDNKCAEKGKVSFMSYDGVHQLHVFIFVLALSHVFYSLLTMALGRFKMRSWKHWERETKTQEYQFSHDSKRFRFARETSFGRRHMSFWSKFPVSLWIGCFFRQITGSVTKVDYLTLRHGFIMAHLAPHNHSRFDFSKYINRSLEEDFKVVVGISPPIWLFAVVFMLFNTHGWYSYLWLPFVPLIIVLVVGTKLLVIISKMGLKIQEKEVVVKGVPVVQPSDDLFWFNRPRLLLYLLNFVLFQNAFQLAFFSLTTYQFGLKSCFHEHMEDLIIKITMGVLIQILCSYVILPLYALVTQMGSTMRPTIFNDRVATALRKWHHTARRKIKENKKWGQMMSPMSSRPETPSHCHRLSRVHLLGHYRSNIHDFQDSLTRLNLNNENWAVDVSPLATNPMSRDSTCQHEIELGYMNQGIDQVHNIGSSQVALCYNVTIENEHKMVIEVLKDFSFDKRSNI